MGSTGQGFGVESGPGDKGFRCAYIGNIADMADMAKAFPHLVLFIPC